MLQIEVVGEVARQSMTDGTVVRMLSVLVPELNREYLMVVHQPWNLEPGEVVQLGKYFASPQLAGAYYDAFVRTVHEEFLSTEETHALSAGRDYENFQQHMLEVKRVRDNR